ncbi:hypothetical protein [Actinacidiphila reveromycinica]|nr:hypothetical protein [Streptomyces sp. SN-593]
MFRKIVLSAVLAGALVGVGAPLASAASSSPSAVPSAASPDLTKAFGGVYPSLTEAQLACEEGIIEHRWVSCSYGISIETGQTELWVYV